jgi:hypothetical protein
MGNFKDSEYYISGRSIENAKLGTIKSSLKTKELKLERIKKYNENPKLCLNCNNPIDYDKKCNKFCSKSCSAIYNNKIREISEEHKKKTSLKLTGRKLSQETKDKLKGHITPEETKRKISDSIKKYYKSDNHHTFKGRVVTEETKKKLSISMILAHQNGKMKGIEKSIRCEYDFNGLKIRCESKVEYTCVDYFIKNYDVKTIKRCDFFIEYIFNNQIKRYLPDFIVETQEKKYIVECKSFFKITDAVINSKSWSMYYNTIEPKKLELKKYCEKNGYVDFFFTKELHRYFYDNCKPKKKYRIKT